MICKWCGKEFTPDKHRIKYCSDECARHAKRRREQNKKRWRRNTTGDQKNTRISLSEVYERDKGVCQICGLPVPRDCDRNDDWAASRDHIIPITKRGAHTYFNCQLAHRICNSAKQDNGAEFRIDWMSRILSDPERWEKKINHLRFLLAREERSKTG